MNLSQEDIHPRETNFITCTHKPHEAAFQSGVFLWQNAATPTQQAQRRQIVHISHLGGEEGDSGSFQSVFNTRNDHEGGTGVISNF